MESQYQRIYQDQFNAAQMRLAETVINQLVNERVTYVQAKEAGFATTTDEAEDIIYENFTDPKTKQFDPDAFTKILRANGYTEASYTSQVTRQLTNMKFRRFASGNRVYAAKFVEMDYKLGDSKLDLDYLKLGKETSRLALPNPMSMSF